MELCITADDYGLSRGVNAAIEALAEAGRISAVSVMAHRDAALDSVRRLAGAGVAVGLHVCFTGERPLVGGLGDRLPPDHRRLFAAIARRPALVGRLRAEAEAQAERLAAAGVAIDFVNAHEHVHLFPPLWPLFAGLVGRVGARAVRAALGQPLELSAAGALAACSRIAWAAAPVPEVVVLSPLGVGLAGRLTAGAVGSLVARPFAAAAGRVRELCVHPALDNPGRRAEHELLASGALARLLDARALQVTRGLPVGH